MNIGRFYNHFIFSLLLYKGYTNLYQVLVAT